MRSSVAYVPYYRWILWKSVEWFLRSPAAYKQTNADENITSLLGVITLTREFCLE